MQPIVCRVNPRLWWMVPVAFFEAGFMFCAPLLAQSDPPPNASIWLIALITWPFGAFFLFCLFWMIRELTHGIVRADDNGLTWQGGFAARKSARWDEIRDFYLHPTQTGTHTVETDNGKLQLSKTFIGVDALIEIIPRRAVNAPARAWETRGYRSQGDWSQTLAVWSKSQKWTAPSVSAALVFAFGILLLWPFLEPRNQRPSIGFLWDSLVPLLAFVFFVVPLAGLFGWAIFSMWRERKFAWNRRDEKLHLSAQGVIFESARNRVEASWDEVQRVERLPPENGFGRTRVTTRNGEFTLWHLSNSELLNLFGARCRSYAPAAIEHLDRQLNAESSLDSEISPMPAADDGAQTFSLRTRSNRLILGTINLVLVLAPLLYLIIVHNNAVDEPFAPSWPLFGALCVLAVVVSLPLYLWFARAFIVVTPGELQLHSPFRSPRLIDWDRIEAAGADMSGNWVRVNGRKIYWMRGFPPARLDDLRQIIEIRSLAHLKHSGE